MSDPEPPNPYTSAPYNPYAAPTAESLPQRAELFEASLFPAPVLTRIGAHLIDVGVFVGLFLGSALAYGVVLGALGSAPDPEVSNVAPALMILPGIIVEVVLQAAIGQSLGKRLLGLRVVDVDGRPASFVRVVFLRNVVPIAIQMFCSILAIADLFSLFGMDGRTVHDRMAGTRVVRVTRESSVRERAPIG